MIEKILIFAGFIICGYLIGNISFARILGKMQNKDITKLGSGNPGTMNTARNFGLGMGVLNLILDISKAVILCLGAYFVAKYCFVNLTNILVYTTGFAVVLGHIFPVFYHFKGGKGIAVTLGIFAVLYPLWFAGMMVLGLVVLLTTQIGSVTSLTVVLGLSVVGIVFNTNFVEIILICVLYALLLFAHRENLKRLFAGKENKVVLFKKKNKNCDNKVVENENNKNAEKSESAIEKESENF